VPFIQSVSVLPSDVRLYDMDISDVITEDKRSMVADSFVLWQITDPDTFVPKMPGGVSRAQEFIGNNAYNSLKNVISTMRQAAVISGRDTLANRVIENLGGVLDSYGLKILSIETKRLDLPEDNRNAVYDRMISERNNIAERYIAEGEEEARKIRTKTDREVNILVSNANAEAALTIAEGELMYMEIISDAFNSQEKSEFYSFVRALDAAKISLRGGDNTLILGRDSPIAQIFYRY